MLVKSTRLASHEKFGRQVKLQPFLFRFVMLKPAVVWRIRQFILRYQNDFGYCYNGRFSKALDIHGGWVVVNCSSDMRCLYTNSVPYAIIMK